jgi:hypothetical protein
MGAIPIGDAPVRELYSYLLGTYLPTRYPSMFDLVQVSNHDGFNSSNELATMFRNKVTNLTFPLHPPPADPLAALQILGETVEDDMFLLLRNGEEGEHRAVAFVCCHPSGFDPAEKLGKKLVDIHGPVPAYDKIEASMERFFGRLGVGKSVKRVNVGFVLLSIVFCLSLCLSLFFFFPLLSRSLILTGYLSVDCADASAHIYPERKPRPCGRRGRGRGPH